MCKIERITGWVFIFSGIVILLIGIYMFCAGEIVEGSSTGRMGETVEGRMGPYDYIGIAIMLLLIAIPFLWKRSPKPED